MAQPAHQLTTEEIQKMLEDNAHFIRAIVDLQNTGRLEESAQYSDKLHSNLIALAVLADAQAESQNPTPVAANSTAR